MRSLPSCIGRGGLAALFLLFAGNASAQHEVGRTTIHFVDASRGDRAVSARIKYPADVEGQDVAPAAGLFPVVAWGHGLTVLVGSYTPLWEALVPAGYVVVLPLTEGTFGANPLELGRDLAFVISAMQAESQDSTSLFFGAIDASVSAIGGHSMGGGAATLGAAENPWIDALVSLTALETNPSAIAAAANIFMPSLVVGGTADCVTPVAGNQRPMYENLSADCRYLVELTGGTHCGFLDPGSNCENFEGGCPTDSLQRAQQIAQMEALVVPWLDAHLGHDALAWSTFQAALATDPQLSWEGTCNVVSAPVARGSTLGLTALPNPSAVGFSVQWSAAHAVRTLRVHDVRGRSVRQLHADVSPAGWDGRSATGERVPGGVYWIRAELENGSHETVRVVLLR
ncbi:MAG: hypothetical protein DHS20C21_16230 [Gemmatimonadota bacterium]|nr:MAG: hypothetical protein DHS20C21_16230 [Gemmatimonadota bacterium]